MKKIYLSLMVLTCVLNAAAQTPAPLYDRLLKQAGELNQQVVEWRRYFHEHPELSTQEVKTSAHIAELLRGMGLEVTHPVAHTGVVALLKGGKPGPVVALRADIDGLPITERNDLPFISRQRGVYNGVETGVMHACGHDGHISILLGVANLLSQNRADLPGTVKFIFQPAEEGANPGEKAGAALMVEEGVLDHPKADAIFGLHLQSLLPLGSVAYRPEGLMASVDGFNIKVIGKGAHGATPWDGVDPIVIGSQIVTALQTIVSRQTELTRAGAVITIGSFHGGVRRNIIPEEVLMEGTIRTFDPEMQKTIHQKIRQTATAIAESAGAKAEVTIDIMYPVTYNDPALTKLMEPSLAKGAQPGKAKVINPVTMAEDFSFFQQRVPGLFFFVGAYPEDLHLTKQPTHHTADFMIDEKSLQTGVRTLLTVTTDYLFMNKTTRK